MDNLFNERLNVVKRTLKREYYPRHLKQRGGLSQEFIETYKKERQKLILGGANPKNIDRWIVKALRFHKFD